MALSSILNGTHTVPLQHSQLDLRVTLGFELRNGAVVCHPSIKARTERAGKSS
jgi:hypothetical protein